MRQLQPDRIEGRSEAGSVNDGRQLDGAVVVVAADAVSVFNDDKVLMVLLFVLLSQHSIPMLLLIMVLSQPSMPMLLLLMMVLLQHSMPMLLLLMMVLLLLIMVL